MNFQEWKDEFAKRCDSSIEAVSHMHDHMNTIDEITGEFDEDELLTFVSIKTVRMQKALHDLEES